MIVVQFASMGINLRLRASRVRTIARVAVSGTVVLIWSMFVVLANNERLAIWQQTELSSSNTVRLIALDIRRSLDLVDLMLRDLESSLALPDHDRKALSERNQSLYSKAGLAELFLPMIVVDGTGNLSVEQHAITPSILNYSNKDYFQHFLKHANDDLFVGTPTYLQSSGNRTLPLVRGISRSHGIFAGVVVGGLSLDHIERLFQQVDLSVDGNIALIKAGNAIVVQWPNQGDKTVHAVAFQTGAPSDAIQSVRGLSTSDGHERLWVTSPIQGYPLWVTIGVSTSPLFRGWYCRVIGSGIVLLSTSMLVAVLMLWLIRELTRRTSSEVSRDAALDNMSQGLIYLNNARQLIVCNRRYSEMFRLPLQRTQPGAPLVDVLKCRIDAGTFPKMTVAEYLARFDRAALSDESFNVTDKLGDGRTVASQFRLLEDGAWIITHEDITKQCADEENLVFMARHDALTRLPNRVLFQERLKQAINMSERGVRCAILCLDLDHFKQVNDTFGHPTGDNLLHAAGSRLRACVRDIDTVARLGGDEFAVIQLDIGGPKDAESLSRRIITAFQEPFFIDEHRIVIGTCIGIAMMAQDEKVSPERLLKSVDIALYLAKKDGRNSMRFFEAEVEAKMQQRRELEADLANALARNEFELYYQPLINLASKKVSGFEALLRWNHPTRGQVGPAEFIPIAEETGLIVAIGHWLLHSACSEAQKWPDRISVAVNLSPVQFTIGSVVTSVEQALSASGLPANRLELEITESVLLLETNDNLTTLHRLRSLGIAIALDDFGTGFSSLSYVRSFPFDKIKIDQSFTRDLMTTRESRLIIRAVMGLGQSLGIRTLAEGVETREQLEKLWEEGCTEVQGYLFSPPRPASEAATLIRCIQVQLLSIEQGG